MDIERQVIGRCSVSEAGVNRQAGNYPTLWSVLPTNGRPEGLYFQGA